MFGPVIIGTVRTAVPTIVGGGISWLALRGFEIDPATQETVTLAALGVITAAYYAIVTTLERQVSPKIGWLLGIPRPPEYYTPDPPSIYADDERYLENHPDAPDEEPKF